MKAPSLPVVRAGLAAKAAFKQLQSAVQIGRTGRGYGAFNRANPATARDKPEDGEHIFA